MKIELLLTVHPFLHYYLDHTTRRIMQKSFLSGLLLFCISLAYSQEVIYTVSALKDDQTTRLDSILFENLDNQTKFVVGNLPDLPAYNINLSLQLLVTSISQDGLPIEKAFRLVKNTPGEVGVQYTGNALEHVRLTMFNMAGQSVYAQTIHDVNPQEIITVNIPSAGMYVLSIETKSGRVQFKAFGSNSGWHGTYNLSIKQQPIQNNNAATTQTTRKSALLSDDFSYQVGDSLRVTAFLDGHYTHPHGSRITGSRSISFTMLQGTAFTDPRDGQVYRWVMIGDQVWMAENLNFASANSWCFGNNATNCDHYGRLYTWAAVMNGVSSSSANPSGVQGVCPTGWHVPSDAEWTDLVNYVDSQGYPNSNVVGGAGNALKSCHQVGSPLGGACNTSDHPRWNSHSTHYGTDAFGFSALPGGSRATTESFGSIGRGGTWWSSTESSSTSAWYWGMSYHFGTVSRYAINEANGFSLRCVRD